MIIKFKKAVGIPLSIGIDASLSNTAVVVLNAEGKLLWVESIKSKQRKIARLIEIRDRLKWIVSQVPCNEYSRVMYEGYAFGFGANKKTSNLTSLAELRGVLATMLIDEFELPIYPVAPNSLKKFATGKGVGDKNQVILKVYQKWRVELANDDETDAYVLAKIGQAMYNKSIVLKPYEKEVLKTIAESDQNINAEGL